LDLQVDYLGKDNQPGRLITYFLDLIGDKLLIDFTPTNQGIPPNQDYRTGQVQFSLVAELIMSLRFLAINSQPWGEVIHHTIVQSLKTIPSLVGPDSSPNQRDAKSALASLRY
jgi:hypothetical protein